MKAIITGAHGFIGKNLAVALHRANVEVAEIDIESPPDALIEGVRRAAVVFHLAGINRPDREEEYDSGNVSPLLSLFKAIDHVASRGQVFQPLILLSSSCQAMLDNPYGRSKVAAEQALREYSIRTRTPAKIYRLPGVFGKWCRPNYNSVVATFCHNIARDLPLTVSDPTRIIELVHIDDVVAEFMGSATGTKDPEGIVQGRVEPSFSVSVGELAERLKGFREKFKNREIIDTSEPFVHRLFGTYASYLPIETLASKLEQKHDGRGMLVELHKAKHTGQLFVSRTHPGIVRGNHYHDLKSEKFYVLEGEALIRLRPVLGAEITEYRISGNDSAVVDVPPGVTHNITNIGADELIVLFWASEIFDPEHPDTYPAEV